MMLKGQVSKPFSMEGPWQFDFNSENLLASARAAEFPGVSPLP